MIFHVTYHLAYTKINNLFTINAIRRAPTAVQASAAFAVEACDLRGSPHPLMRVYAPFRVPKNDKSENFCYFCPG